MSKVYIHAYVPAEATPDVADEINGVTEEIDEQEYVRNPEYYNDKCRDNFIKWLKGHPEGLRSHTEVILNESPVGYYEDTHEHILTEAEGRKARGKTGLVGELHKIRVSVGKWKNQYGTGYFIKFYNTKDKKNTNRRVFELS